MRTIVFVFASFCFVSAAFSDDSCKVQATGKNLARCGARKLCQEVRCKDQATAQEAAWRRGD